MKTKTNIAIPPPPPLDEFKSDEIKSDEALSIKSAEEIAAETTNQHPEENKAATALTAEYITTLEQGTPSNGTANEVKTTKNTSVESLPNLPADVFAKAELSQTAKQESEWIEKKDIPENLQLSDKQTGVHIERIQVVHFPSGDMIAGYNDKNEQVLFKSGNDLFINPTDSERAALGKPDGKAGWYRKYDDQIRKVKEGNYGFAADHSFVSRDKDNPHIAKAYTPDGRIIEGKFNAAGAMIETNAQGNISTVRNVDHTVQTMHYANENDPNSLNSFDEMDVSGNKITWAKVADTSHDFAYKDARGNQHIRQDVALTADGHLSYSAEKVQNQKENNVIPALPVANRENVPADMTAKVEQIETWQDRDARMSAQGFTRVDGNNQEYYWRDNQGGLLLDKQNNPIPAYHKYETSIGADGRPIQQLVWAPMDDCIYKSK